MDRSFENDDDDFDEDIFDSIPSEENRREIIEAINIDLAQASLEQGLLAEASKIAEKDWLWKFRKPETKLIIIKKIYGELAKILDE